MFVSPLLPKHVLLSNIDGSVSLVTEDLKRVVSTKDFFTVFEVKTAKKGKKDAAASQEKTGSTIWATTFNTTGSWITSSALAPNTLIIMTIVELTSEKKATVSLKYVNEEQRGFSTFGEVDIEAAAGASGFAFDVQSGQLSFMSKAWLLQRNHVHHWICLLSCQLLCSHTLYFYQLPRDSSRSTTLRRA